MSLILGLALTLGGIGCPSDPGEEPPGSVPDDPPGTDPDNEAPSLTVQSFVAVPAGTSVTLEVQVEDEEVESVAVTASVAPGGVISESEVSIETAGNDTSITITALEVSGTATVTVTATDAEGLSASADVTVEVSLQREGPSAIYFYMPNAANMARTGTPCLRFDEDGTIWAAGTHTNLNPATSTLLRLDLDWGEEPEWASTSANVQSCGFVDGDFYVAGTTRYQGDQIWVVTEVSSTLTSGTPLGFSYNPNFDFDQGTFASSLFGPASSRDEYGYVVARFGDSSFALEDAVLGVVGYQSEAITSAGTMSDGSPDGVHYDFYKARTDASGGWWWVNRFQNPNDLEEAWFEDAEGTQYPISATPSLLVSRISGSGEQVAFQQHEDDWGRLQAIAPMADDLIVGLASDQERINEGVRFYSNLQFARLGQDGSVLWTASVEPTDATSIRGMTIGPDGTIFAFGTYVDFEGSSNNDTVYATVYAINPENGDIIWHQTYGQSLSGQVGKIRVGQAAVNNGDLILFGGLRKARFPDVDGDPELPDFFDDREQLFFLRLDPADGSFR